MNCWLLILLYGRDTSYNGLISVTVWMWKLYWHQCSRIKRFLTYNKSRQKWLMNDEARGYAFDLHKQWYELIPLLLWINKEVSPHVPTSMNRLGGKYPCSLWNDFDVSTCVIWWGCGGDYMKSKVSKASG